MTNIIESGIHLDVKMDNLVNERLREQTVKISNLLDGAKYNLYEVAMRLLVIKNEELYKEDNFTDIYDYTKKVFGYGKNMTYKMIKTAETLVEQKGEEYRSIICHDDSDYSMSQLFELGTLAPKEVVELDADGAINPSMTTKEIREVVKDTKEMMKKEAEGEEEPTEGETEGEAEVEEGEPIIVDTTAFKAELFKVLSEMVANNKEVMDVLAVTEKKMVKAINSLVEMVSPKSNN
mgnify:FL=1